MNPRDEVPLVKHTCHQSPLAHNDLPHPVNLRRETHTVNSHQNPVAPSLLCAIISVGLAPRKKSRQSFLCGEDRQRGQAWRPGRTGEGTFSSGAVTEPARPWDRSPHDPPTHPQIQRPQKRPMESKPKRPPTTSSPPKAWTSSPSTPGHALARTRPGHRWRPASPLLQRPPDL